ncbi:hypothetical protein ACR6C2_44120 [Streptomyces sp. INA 01156]
MLTRFDVAPSPGPWRGRRGRRPQRRPGMTSVHGTTRRIGNVARNALGGGRHWRAGRRVHLALRNPGGDAGPLARKVATELLDHPTC